MALVSPGIQISINDQSQYVNSNIGSVPLVVLATAQDKTYNSAAATGTSKANAGMLQSFASQRELVTALGTPTFQLSASGTPVNGSELNEYGLLAAYSALGVSNQLYAIRADVDLAQLTGTSVRPTADAADGTYWLNTAETQFGIYELSTNSFTNLTPLIISSSKQVYNDSNYAYNVPTPISSVGSPGDYALVFVNTDGTTAKTIRLFYKTDSTALPAANGGPGQNTWVQVGGTSWQYAVSVGFGTATNVTISNSSTLTINTVTVTTAGSGTLGISDLAAAINTAGIAGVKAASINGKLALYVTSAAKSNGSTIDGKMIISDGLHAPLAVAGFTTSTAQVTTLNSSGAYYAPYMFYGSYAQAPSGGWYSTDAQPRPNGSIWWKTTSVGNGFTPVFNKYSSATMNWTTLNSPMYQSLDAAIYAFDPIGGGVNIAIGQPTAIFGISDTTSNNLQFFTQSVNNVSTGTGGQLLSATPFTASTSFRIQSSAPGTSELTTTTITLSSTSPSSFVSDVLAANIPYVTATFNSADGTYGSISFTHTAGGDIILSNITTGVTAPLTVARFVAGQGSNLVINAILNTIEIDSWTNVTNLINYQSNMPYTAPATGTYWYYSNPADIDIMVNDNGWKGYQNVTSDVRGYNLSNTDDNGPIISAGTAPIAQSSGAQLQKGDMWLDSSDLVNYPKLYRYNGVVWVAIDNTDHTSGNGIIFADARWDTTGTTDVISGDLPAISTLNFSNYIDLDAPDYRLYPRGTLLFNTRRSGYNVKKFVANYFNSTSFPVPSSTPNTPSMTPSVTNAWVSVSGTNSKGVMNSGSEAQRAIVVAALASAIDSNTDVIEDIYNFNLLVCPGYPEVTANLINLNNNRSNTGFIIGDTPMTLAPNTIDITNWVNNNTGSGLPQVAATDPYTGIYYPAGRTTDLAGNVVAVPASYAVLRTFLHSDQISYPWFAPAGVTRGLVSNLTDLGYINATTGAWIHNGINQGIRDAIYPLNINPITQLPNTGIVVWGQKTRNASTTSRSSVNVVRLENYLRRIFKTVSNGYLFEQNDTITRKSIARQIEGALNDVLSKRGVYDFLVICDTSNNTSQTIAAQQLYVDVAIEPMRDVEFIYIPIALYNPGDISALQVSST